MKRRRFQPHCYLRLRSEPRSLPEAHNTHYSGARTEPLLRMKWMPTMHQFNLRYHPDDGGGARSRESGSMGDGAPAQP